MEVEWAKKFSDRLIFVNSMTKGLIVIMLFVVLIVACVKENRNNANQDKETYLKNKIERRQISVNDIRNFNSDDVFYLLKFQSESKELLKRKYISGKIFEIFDDKSRWSKRCTEFLVSNLESQSNNLRYFKIDEFISYYLWLPDEAYLELDEKILAKIYNYFLDAKSEFDRDTAIELLLRIGEKQSKEYIAKIAQTVKFQKGATDYQKFLCRQYLESGGHDEYITDKPVRSKNSSNGKTE